jgi:hypothetical protein
MNSVYPVALVLLLLVATLSGAQGATPAPVPPGSEACGVELTAYQPTLLNKIYVAPAMAQGFRVYDRSRIFSFTSSFFTVGTFIIILTFLSPPTRSVAPCCPTF